MASSQQVHWTVNVATKRQHLAQFWWRQNHTFLCTTIYLNVLKKLVRLGCISEGFLCRSHQLERPGVVYHIPCTNCPKTYIGQTGRTLTQCLKEHRRAVTNGDLATSALAEHAHSTGHPINWTEARVIATCSHTSRRCLLKSWMIHKETNHLHE